ncbi:hypothetical protein BJX68DRAFT_122790 [Aspergillus pseudodeflectus]|uniref:Uncharacterized protein n=1 Tax=Aspergillus pseudodeflectus TaxID=176178 RepID=A0ABR4K3C8_9EURO
MYKRFMKSLSYGDIWNKSTASLFSDSSSNLLSQPSTSRALHGTSTFVYTAILLIDARTVPCETALLVKDDYTPVAVPGSSWLILSHCLDAGTSYNIVQIRDIYPSATTDHISNFWLSSTTPVINHAYHMVKIGGMGNHRLIETSEAAIDQTIRRNDISYQPSTEGQTSIKYRL